MAKKKRPDPTMYSMTGVLCSAWQCRPGVDPGTVPAWVEEFVFHFGGPKTTFLMAFNKRTLPDDREVTENIMLWAGDWLVNIQGRVVVMDDWLFRLAFKEWWPEPPPKATKKKAKK